MHREHDYFKIFLHDLKNQLQLISLNLDLSGGKNITEREQRLENIKRIIGQTTANVCTMYNLLEKENQGPVMVNLAALLEQLLDFITPYFRFHNVNIETIISPAGKDAQIHASYYRLFSVFLNITVNALQALQLSEKDKRFSLTLYIDKTRAVISFYDTARGIPENQKNIIFTGHTTRINGSGLGLKASREYIENLGGHITVSDNFPQGSCFKVTLPLTDYPVQDLKKSSKRIKKVPVNV